MLRQSFSVVRPAEIRARGPRADRAMSVLQYGMAALAIGAALLLGVIR